MRILCAVAAVAALAGCGASISSFELQKAIAAKRSEAVREIEAARGAAEVEIDRSLAAGKRDEAQARARAGDSRLAELGRLWAERMGGQSKELLGRCGSDSIMVEICNSESARAAEEVAKAGRDAREALARRVK